MAGKVLITGAYGYLGTVIRTRLTEAGWATSALVRNPRDGDLAERWSLSDPPDEELLRSCDALVHCAYDFGPRSRADVWDVNVHGSARLLEAAEAAGVGRVVVISSMSAYAGTAQIYGQAKLAIERVTVEKGGIAIRPGLVWGSEPRGMAGTLRKLAGLPILPDLGPAAQQYPVHDDDVARVVAEILGSPDWRPEVFGVAQAEAISFRALLMALAPDDRRRRFLRVPWQSIYGALVVAERLGIGDMRADSILGLVRPAPSVPASTAFPELQQTLRKLEPRAARAR